MLHGTVIVDIRDYGGTQRLIGFRVAASFVFDTVRETAKCCHYFRENSVDIFLF